MSRIEFAFVMPGAASFKDAGIANVTDTYHGQVLTRGRDLKTAILKDLDPKELANEIIAAGLAADLGLPVPQAFIGVTEPGNPCASRTLMEDGRGLVFVSVNVGTPSIASLVLSELESDIWVALQPIAAFLAKEPWIGCLYGFDTWVANVDRHIGNLLFSAGAGAWIIDHGRCFTGQSWEASDLIADKDYRNRLVEWLTPLLSAVDRKKIADAAAAFSTRLPEFGVREMNSGKVLTNLIGDADFDALENFLHERIAVVSKLAALALNEPRIL